MSCVTTLKHHQSGRSATIDASLTKAWPQLALHANFSWALAGNVVFAACQFGLLVVLARWGSAESVGQFVLATAIATPITTFSMLHLRALLATDARGEYRVGEFLALRLITTSGAWVIIVTVGLAGGYSGSMGWLIVLAGVISTADALSDLLHGVFQRHERLDCAAVALMCKGPLGLAAVLAGAMLGKGALGAIVGLAASRWLLLLVIEFPWATRMESRSVGTLSLRPVWNRVRLQNLAWTALPLGVVMLLMSVRTNLPRYLLDYHVGAKALGIFASIFAVTQLGSLVINALGQAASPRLALYAATGQRQAFCRLTLKLVLLGLLLGMAGLAMVFLAGSQILVAIFGDEFKDQSHLMMILMGAAAFSFAAGPLGYAATASRRIRWQPMFHLFNLAITAAVAWYSVAWGMKGMAVAVLVTAVLGVLLFAMLLCTKPDERMKIKHGAVPHDAAEDRVANMERGAESKPHSTEQAA